MNKYELYFCKKCHELWPTNKEQKQFKRWYRTVREVVDCHNNCKNNDQKTVVPEVAISNKIKTNGIHYPQVKKK